LDSGREMTLSPHGVRLETESTFQLYNGAAPLVAGGDVFLGNGRVRCRIASAGAFFDQLGNGGIHPAEEAWVRWDSGPLRVRTWQSGDRFRPKGAPGSRKVQDWFTDRKIPAARRRELPVVMGGEGEILWIPGFPAAECSLLRDRNNQALRLTYDEA